MVAKSAKIKQGPNKCFPVYSITFTLRSKFLCKICLFFIFCVTMKVLRGFEVPRSRSRNWDPSGERGPGHTGHRQTIGPCSPLPPPTGGSLHKHRGPGERDLRGLQYMGLGRKTRGPGRVGMCSRPRCRIVFSKTWEHCTKTDREN